MGCNAIETPSPDFRGLRNGVDENSSGTPICGSDWQFATSEELKRDLRNEFGTEERTRGWSDATEVVKTYYEELVPRWKEELDTLLVYAGLVSAILAAFNVEAYGLLQPDPSDTMVTVLQQISAQLDSLQLNRSSASPLPSRPCTDYRPPFETPTTAVWINSLWFSSLVCSLASASIALLVKQWLHQAITGLSGTSHDSARLRQHRLDGLLRWRVGTIIDALPILLQTSLALFLVGLVILLWTLHDVVASIITCIVGILLAFSAAMTIIPVFKWDCSYRSPQSFAIYAVFRLIFNTTKGALDRLFIKLWLSHVKLVGRMETESVFFRLWHWNRRHHSIPTWHGREQVQISSNAGLLDRRIVTTAYATTLSTTHLDRLHVILPDLPWEQLDSALEEIWSVCEKHWSPSTSEGVRVFWMKHVEMAELAALYATRHMLAVPERDRDDKWHTSIRHIIYKLISIDGPPRCGLELFITTISPLALGDDDLARIANEKLAAFWTISKTARIEEGSYSVMRCVLAASEWRLKNSRKEDYNFDNFKEWLRVGRSVLLCISRSSPNSKLSTEQLATVHTIGRSILVLFEEVLKAQDWTSMKPGRDEMEEGRDEIWARLLPHHVSFLFAEWIIAPMMAAFQSEPARHAIPSSLPRTLEESWSAVQLACPEALDVTAIEEFSMYTSITTIATQLESASGVLSSRIRGMLGTAIVA
ncbi:hypothetical protein C8Q76DRAFT_795052 [Earliella scabrosa]|nr:hypothetical protein C8Q76DRAFT_795052 [Earliella scabrosa]